MRLGIGIAGLISLAMCIGAIIFLLMGKMSIAVPLLSVGLVILIISYGAAFFLTHRGRKK